MKRMKLNDPQKIILGGIIFLLFILPTSQAVGATITFSTRGGVVWAQEQSIAGRISPSIPGTGTLYVNGIPQALSVTAPGDSFFASLRIGRGTTVLVASVDSSGVPMYSDTLRLTLGYIPLPELQPYATVSGRTVTLHAGVVSNPDSALLSFLWSEDTANPRQLGIPAPSDSTVAFDIPSGAAAGEYYFSVLVTTSAFDTLSFKTFITVDSLNILPVNIANDHAIWIERAVIYEITPYNFVAQGKFQNITDKIPELAALGINTIWIQPVYATAGGGQGYDVTDYFKLRTDLGSEASLRTLIRTAHANGMHVLFDFVPNHTSLYHAYAQDAVSYGASSHYYDFYERAKDTAPYSSNENILQSGNMQFIYYFWNSLVNLNYNNPEVQRMIIEAGKYWMRRLDVDGYRVDAVWGVNARNPEFMKQWRLALKRIKPEALLLAEDKASVKVADPAGRPCVFDQRFDAAFDWTAEESWVSHWVWQAFYSSSSNPTIFNTAAYQTSAALRNSLTNNGQGYDPRAVVLHFMENNDTYRFLATHDLARTKMVGELMFALPGIPLLYNGQEIGFGIHPYSTYAIFQAGSSIQSLDQYGLFSYYQTLIRLRKEFSALTSKNIQSISVSPANTVYGFRRWDGGQNIFVMTNMSSSASSVTAVLPMAQLGLDSMKTYYLTDMLTNEYLSGSPSALDTVQIAMSGYSTRAFILADSVVRVLSVGPVASSNVPSGYLLEQNYPNPFNPATTIGYRLPEESHVRLEVFDLIGSRVAVLVDAVEQAGERVVRWNAAQVASGVYFCRLQATSLTHSSKAFLQVRRMVVVK